MIAADIPVTERQAQAAMVRVEHRRGWAIAETPECVPELRRRDQRCVADATSLVYAGPLFGYPETTLVVRVARRHGRLVVRDVLPTMGNR